MHEIWKFCIKKKFLSLTTEKLHVGANSWIVKVTDLDGVMQSDKKVHLSRYKYIEKVFKNNMYDLLF